LFDSASHQIQKPTGDPFGNVLPIAATPENTTCSEWFDEEAVLAPAGPARLFCSEDPAEVVG
jgi:hypothetical protein